MNVKNTVDKVNTWKKFYKRNIYYHKELQRTLLHILPKDESIIEFSCRGGELLSAIPNKVKVGVEFDLNYVTYAKKKSSKLKVYSVSEFWKFNKNKYDYIFLNHTLTELDNIQDFIRSLKKISHEKTKVVVFYFNYFWKPVLDITQKLGLRMPYFREPNWLSKEDIDGFFYLEDYQQVKFSRSMLLPLDIPILSNLINKYLSVLPILNSLSITNYSIYSLKKQKKEYSVSIIIPARNEEGNMRGIFKKIPRFGKAQELIFVEGHSQDDTYKVIKNEIAKYKGKIKASFYKQKGKGKGDAVSLGFSKAKNEILMILDADLTVDPKELPKFYNTLTSGKGDFIMGSRLIYPMESLAMRTLNILGNKFFSLAFSFLLDQRIKDTLCGTKVLFRRDYEKIKKSRRYFGNFDPFGDYDLIFGASKLNLKILEIPIRYKERTYGKTNISRFTHGWLLLKMVIFAAKKLKFI